MTPPRWMLSLGTALLLLFVVTRWVQLGAFPIFLDEADHVRWAADLYQARPFTGAINGKLFGLWWLAAFDMRGDGALWAARAGTVLFVMVGVALLMRIGRHLGGWPAGLLAGLLYAAAPYAFFYDRLALMDAYVGTWAAAAAWFALRWSRTQRRCDAILCGLALVGALLAKATGVFVAVLPLLVWLLGPSRARWRALAAGSLWCYGTFGAAWLPFYLFLRWRGYGYFGTATTVVGTGSLGGLPERLAANSAELLRIDALYLHAGALLACGLLAAYGLRRPQRTLLLLALVAVPAGGLLAFSTKMSARYFHFHVLFVALAAGVAGWHWAQQAAWQRRAAAVGLLAWLALWALPFASRYLSVPETLPLPALDQLEYIQSDAAGFALPALAAVLRQQAAADGTPIVAYGLLANCHAVGFALPDDGPVQWRCPHLTLEGSTLPAIMSEIDAAAAAAAQPVYVVYEASAFVRLDGLQTPLRPVTRLVRPGGLTTLALLRAAPAPARQ